MEVKILNEKIENGKKNEDKNAGEAGGEVPEGGHSIFPQGANSQSIFIFLCTLMLFSKVIDV